MAQGLLGGLDAAAFLHRHWQKRPHFVRDALPGCGDWLNRDALFEWATRDDVESRLVSRVRNRWSVRQGPFRLGELRRLPMRGWTLLVQGVEQIHLQATALLQRFSFIPHARLDDLMVSYAPQGGGVGPHFDSYDVFLLQGPGTRRWHISAQKDLTLVDNAPLRILRHFRPTREWLCEQGDLLYLPPRYAHEGVAVDSCMTLSIGFRAPRAQALATHFLEFLQDELQLPGIYEDRNLKLQQHPAEISSDMLRQFAGTLQRIRWRAGDIRRFCGCYLTEPKPQTLFRRPRRPASLPAFSKRVAAKGMRLTLPSRLLFSGHDFFINGEHHRFSGRGSAELVRLADQRQLPAFSMPAPLARVLHTWYCAGYLEM